MMISYLNMSKTTYLLAHAPLPRHRLRQINRPLLHCLLQSDPVPWDSFVLVSIRCRLLELFKSVFPYSNGVNRLIMDTVKVHSIKHCHRSDFDMHGALEDDKVPHLA
jgi:hypothetical protein